MNWGKVKLVMIAILAIACILLSWNIWSLSSSRRYIDEEILVNLGAILEADDIYLSENAVPRERFDADVFVGSLPEDYHQWVYNALSGAPIYRTYTTPNGLMIFTESGDRYHIMGYFKFAYYAAGFLTVTLPTYGTLDPLKLDEKTEQSLLSTVQRFLKTENVLSS
ncbi:MAG: hypothetical protein IJY12_03945, partial [Clostridia bacterium]|nr:hypothetical protein [Clostridia bacterium]